MGTFYRDFFMISHIQSVIAIILLGILFFLIRILQKKEFNFSSIMFVGLFFGLIFGLTCKLYLGEFNVNFVSLKENKGWLYEVYVWLKFIEVVFISLLKLLIIPMVFIGIINVVINIEKHIKVGSILTRAIFWFMLTTAIASTIGMLLGYFTKLGVGNININSGLSREVSSLNEIILGLIPSNIITAMNTNNILGIVIFSFLIAFGARYAGKQKEFEEGFLIFNKLVNFCYQIVIKLASGLIYIMPYAVVAMIANVIIINGLDSIKNASQFIILCYLAGFFVFLIHCLIIFIHGLNPLVYVKKSIPALLMAFTSRSSSGTLPVTISTLTQNLGVNSSIANFVAPLGTTIGMNGCAGYFAGLVAVFIFNSLGMNININDMVLIIILSLITSFGIAGIPGISTMVISIILTGLGLEGYFALVAVIIAIDPIIDMVRTLSNVSGSMVVSIATSQELDSIDTDIYNS